MIRFFRHFRFSMFLIALLCVALGVALLLWPTESQQVFCYAFGAILVLSGIFQVASYVVGQQTALLQKLMFVGGIISAVAGVWILLSPGKVLPLAIIVVGILLLYHGIMDIKYAFDLKNCESRQWGTALIFGLLTCSVGILLLVNPFKNMNLLFFIMAIGFIFDGVSDLFTVVAVASGERKYELAQEKVQAIEGRGAVVDTLPEKPEAPQIEEKKDE